MLARIGRSAFTLATFILAAMGIAAWHHIRIREFIQSVYDLLCEELPGALRKHDAELRSSMLQLRFQGESAVYQLRVRHKARLREIGTEFRGTRSENEQWRDRLAQRLSELKARVGPLIELEESSRTRTRLFENIQLNPDRKRPISRSLTDAQASETAKHFARFIQAVKPLVHGPDKEP